MSKTKNHSCGVVFWYHLLSRDLIINEVGARVMRMMHARAKLTARRRRLENARMRACSDQLPVRVVASLPTLPFPREQGGRVSSRCWPG